MKKILLLSLISFCGYSQADTVIQVTNATVRYHIENFTAQYTKPDAIKFVLDGSGKWITSKENLLNARFRATRQELRDYLQANGVNVPADVHSLKDALNRWGTKILYTPIISNEN